MPNQRLCLNTNNRKSEKLSKSIASLTKNKTKFNSKINLSDIKDLLSTSSNHSESKSNNSFKQHGDTKEINPQRGATDNSKKAALDMANFLKNNLGIKTLNNQIYMYVPEFHYYRAVDPDEFERIVRSKSPAHLKLQINRVLVDETARWLKSFDEIQIDSEVNKANLRYYVNFRNGVLDVATGQKVNDPSCFYFTSFIDSNYPFDSEDEELLSSSFERFLSDVCNNDTEIEYILQESIGLALSEVRDMKVAIFMYGLPNSGKSVLIELLRLLVGDKFCSNVSLHQLSNEQYSVAELVDKKLNAFAEMAEIDLKRLDIFKSLTGNDTMTARQIYQRPFSFKNRALLVFAGNNFPNIKTQDVTNAFFERIQIIPFMNSIAKKNQDFCLIEKLLDEKEYIVKWAMLGLKRLIYKNKFSKCRLSDQIKSEFMNEQDSFREFIEAECEIGGNNYLFSYQIEEAYEKFCSENSYPRVSTTACHKMLKNIYKLTYGKKADGNSKRNGYYGISLKNSIPEIFEF